MQPNTNHTPVMFTVRNNQLYFLVGVKWYKIVGTVMEAPVTELYPTTPLSTPAPKPTK